MRRALQPRARVWDAGARPESITLNIDATLLTAHSEKELAAGNYKHGYGFHPLGCWLDETGEALAAILRPGTPARTRLRITSRCSGSRSRSCPPRTFTARSSSARISAVRRTRSPRTAATLRSGSRLATSCQRRSARRSFRSRKRRGCRRSTAGEDRDGAWVAELTDRIDLSAWPKGSRLICRSERPHPGAQFTIFDEHGYRYTCFLTDQDGNDIAVLELRHRGRARVEDSIRAGKDTGMRNLPHHAFEHNQTWLELSLIAQDLLCWTKLICLTGELATAEPKRLRQRLLHIAAKLVRHGRRTHLKLDRDWPWSNALAAAFSGSGRSRRSAEHTPHPRPDLTTDPRHRPMSACPKPTAAGTSTTPLNDPVGHLRPHNNSHPAIHTPAT